MTMRWISRGVLLTLVLIGCAGPQASVSRPDSAQTNQAAPKKRITLAIMGEPAAIADRIGQGGAGGSPGGPDLESLVNRGVSTVDGQGQRRPEMAQIVPSLENGLWKLSADGRMETTWKLRDDVRWHDGTRFEAADLAFTTRVEQDKDLPFRPNPAAAAIDTVEVVDPSTLMVTWKKPYIAADELFETGALPRHLLEQAWVSEKSTFVQLSYWSTDYVGTGPFRLKEWNRGSQAVLAANADYFLGKPKLDEIEVKFIPDSNALVANLLANGVELTMGGGISVEQAVQARDQWRDGQVSIKINGWIAAFPQLLTPNPAAIGDPQFRRGLLQAIDRQQMVDTIQAGLVPIAHSTLSPKEPEYKEIESAIVRYDYDARRAAQIFEGLGFVRGSDGMLRDERGQLLSIELRSTATYEVSAKAMATIADYWQRVGITVDQSPTPRQLQTDREYRANFPAFNVQRQPSRLEQLIRFTSAEAPRRENGYRGEGKTRYNNPAFDELVDRYFATIPRAERMAVLGNIMQHMTENVVPLGLFFDSAPAFIGRRLQGIDEAGSEASMPTWNVHLWDVKAP